jgi:lipoprotein-anchoring transpeptidase ErfK/SrfK
MLSALRYEIVRRRSLLPGVLAVVVTAGCGSAAAPKTAVEPVTKHVCRAGFQLLGSSTLAYAGIVRSHAEAVRRPGGRPFARFRRLNQNGVPTILSVLGRRRTAACKPTWYRVQLPLRPNGVKGWVRASEVQLATVKTRIEVDLSERRVTLLRAGRRVLAATAAIGSSATPTPTGRFYVNQRLIPLDRSGPFGPGAVGISAFSNVLTGWTQGGPIAIHGTNEPSLIGQAVSNGCIRLPNHILKRVFASALPGTPVDIHP